jgi:hypothetical protein
MAEKNSKNKGNGRNRNSSQKPKTYSGVVKDPQSKKINGRVYLKEDNQDNSIKYGTILVIAVLAGLAATFSSVGNAIVDFFSFNGMSASGIWIMLAAIAGTAGFVLAILDKKTKGKY